MSGPDIAKLLDLAADITSAYVSHNAVPPEALPGVIEDVFKTLQHISDPARLKENAPKPVPALPINQSVTDDFIYSLEDGQPYKSLKRHLKAQYGMSPEDYKEKWDLPADYPMVAPAYGRERSNLAKKSGLGRSHKT
jgi:predicted transcriptional regulator